jgi:parallel beta-helix repeat protein
LDWCLTQNVVCDNTISLNTQAGGRGIYLNRYSSQNEVTGNQVSGGGIGISIWDSDNNLVERNTVENTYIGIGLGDSNHNYVRRNTIKNVTESHFWRGGGIWLYWGRNYYNMVEKNFVVECYDGISIEKSCYTNVCNNLVLRGSGYGLAVTADSNCTTIQRNIALLNEQYDFYWDQTGIENTWTNNHYLTKNW